MDLEQPKPPALIPLCRVDLQLAPAVVVGKGPAGTRMVVDITAMTLTGERLSGTLKGAAAADWLTIVGNTASIDVRATIETHDGALVYVQYRGRADITHGIGAAPIYVAPTFETGDERYGWLNHVQAVGKGMLSDLRYDWYEVR